MVRLGFLSDLTNWAKDFVESAGYLGVFLMIVLENVFPPIPSEAILPLAGFLAGEGRFWLPAVILAATLGAVVGALILYYLAYAFGDQRVILDGELSGRTPLPLGIKPGALKVLAPPAEVRMADAEVVEEEPVN